MTQDSPQGQKGDPGMSLYEFLERLEADPFDPALTELFLGKQPQPEDGDTAEEVTPHDP